ncbi:MobA/MobL family protein, partial [Siphonobacter sp. SORGH_AS_0500]|uniref:MobA/MobL family protein n=1 Tax=Siphonobacter sp. SORGH_AS_0500 TaxID=1864824 RepID=UPI002862B227
MAKGFINVSTSGNGDVSYYSRSQECLYVQSSKNLSKEVPQLLADWKQLEWQEKMGNKELGIRGRHDAQVRKNYTLSLPNELSPQEAARRIEAMIQQTPIKDCSYSIFIHRGQKDGVTNLHAHLLVNERNLTTRKKDRQMIKKEFLEKEFRPRFEKAFASERALGKDLVSRERISTVLFQSSPQAARTLLSDYQQQAKQASEKQALGTLISGYAAAHQAREAVKVAETVPVKSVTPQEPEKVTPVTLEQKWEPAWRAYATELEGRNQRSRDRNGLVDQVAAYLEKNDHPTGVKQVLALKGLPDSLSKELTGKLERYERIQELSRQVKEEQSRLSLKSLNPFLGSKERAAVSAM